MGGLEGASARGVARQCAAWTCGAAEVRLKPHGVPSGTGLGTAGFGRWEGAQRLSAASLLVKLSRRERLASAQDREFADIIQILLANSKPSFFSTLIFFPEQERIVES